MRMHAFYVNIKNGGAELFIFCTDKFGFVKAVIFDFGAAVDSRAPNANFFGITLCGHSMEKLSALFKSHRPRLSSGTTLAIQDPLKLVTG